MGDREGSAEKWVAWSVAITALIVGCGVGFVIGWAVYT